MPSCWAVPHPILLLDGVGRWSKWREWRRWCERWRALSRRRSDILEVLLGRIFGLRETVRTVGVREGELSWIHAMGLMIRLLRDPELTMGGQSRIVSNEPAYATDGEQRRRDIRFPHPSRKRHASGPHHGFFRDIHHLSACRRMTRCALQIDTQQLACRMNSVRPSRELLLDPTGAYQLERSRYWDLAPTPFWRQTPQP
jgi:hypothetical protein